MTTLPPTNMTMLAMISTNGARHKPPNLPSPPGSKQSDLIIAPMKRQERQISMPGPNGTADTGPDPLSAVSWPKERVHRHTVEQMGDCVPVVPLLDVIVPQMDDQLVVVLQGLDKFMLVEQGTEVTKITLEDGTPLRAVLREPLPVEQLVLRHFCLLRVCPVCSGKVPIFQLSSAHN